MTTNRVADRGNLFPQPPVRETGTANEGISERDEVVMVESKGRESARRPNAPPAPIEKTAQSEATEKRDRSSAPVVSQVKTDEPRNIMETIERVDAPAVAAPTDSMDVSMPVSESAKSDSDPVSVAAKPEVPSGRMPEYPVSIEAEEFVPASAAPPTGETESRETPAETTSREYFVRTAEILEGKTQPPAETTTIVLRELQEWIADGARETPAGQVSVDENPVVELSREAESPPDRAGIIRIGEPRASDREIKQPPAAEARPERIAEETFELSIGSISVTIDGDPARPPNHAPPRAAPPGREKGATRKSNGLGRHYL